MKRDPIENLVRFVFGAAAVIGTAYFWIWLITAIQ